MTIETAKDFVKAIDIHMDRMAEGERQRLAHGELPDSELCICGLVIKSRYMEFHIVNSPLHFSAI